MSRAGYALARAALACALVTAPRAARASGHVAGLGLGEAVAPLAVATAVAPSEGGTLVDKTGGNFVLGWSWQIPIPVKDSWRNRVVGGFNWAPSSSAHHVEGRLGYRYSARYALAGLGIAFDHAATTWSPELGFNLPLMKSGDFPSVPSLHFIVRGEIATAFERLDAVTFLVGWTLL